MEEEGCCPRWMSESADETKFDLMKMSSPKLSFIDYCALVHGWVGQGDGSRLVDLYMKYPGKEGVGRCGSEPKAAKEYRIFYELQLMQQQMYVWVCPRFAEYPDPLAMMQRKAKWWAWKKWCENGQKSA